MPDHNPVSKSENTGSNWPSSLTPTVSTSDSSSSFVQRNKAYWKRTNLLSKTVFITCIVALLGFIIGVAVLIDVYLRLDRHFQKQHQPSSDDSRSSDVQAIVKAEDSPGVCLSPYCIEIAARIISSMDGKSDPCHDISQFACGGWIKKQVLPSQPAYATINLDNMQHRIDRELKNLLERPSAEDDLKAFKIIREYYQSCMNTEEEPARKEAIKKLAVSLGGFPKASEWDGAKFELADYLTEIFDVNGAPLFDVMLQVDTRNSSKYILALGPPRQSAIMPQFYSRFPYELFEAMPLLVKKDRADRQKRTVVEFGDHVLDGAHEQIHDGMVDSFLDGRHFRPDESLDGQNFLFSLQEGMKFQKLNATLQMVEEMGFWANYSSDERDAEIGAQLQLMAFLDHVYPSDKEKKVLQQRNEIFHQFTLAEMQQKFGFINWKRFFERIVESEVLPDDLVNVLFPESIEKLALFLGGTFDTRLLHNTLLMLYLRDMGSEILSPPPGLERYQFCVQAANGAYSDALSGLYVWDHPREKLEKMKLDAEELFQVVKSSVISGLSKANWLDARSKVLALDKAKNIKSNFVAPPFFYNATFIEESVGNISTSNLDFAEATFQLYRLFRKDFFSLFRRPVDENVVTWQLLSYPTVANAFYLQHFNSMVIPLALLADPMFSMEGPKYLRMGTLGFIMAHEIMHAFDRTGILFDRHGVMNDWLSPIARERYDAKTQCLVNQYSTSFRTLLPHNGSFTVLQVDGDLTLNENLADVGAIAAVVDAYKSLRLNEPLLPALNYTQEQLMIINAAQAYCAVLTPTAYAVLLGLDEHTPHPERVNGFMMNLPDYERVFQCPKGSRLNPSEKCSLW